jgi:hypothetical protein
MSADRRRMPRAPQRIAWPVATETHPAGYPVADSIC